MRDYLKNNPFFIFIFPVILIFIFNQACHQNPEKKQAAKQIKRVGSVIRIEQDKLAEYKKLHANVWPEVNAILTDCNIHNYSIYYKDGYLFSYFEYTGNDYAADMKKMADNPITKKWWKLTNPLQTPLDSRKEGEWWSEMEEVYHLK
jgi:L-rhamnose mutarotase